MASSSNQVSSSSGSSGKKQDQSQPEVVIAPATSTTSIVPNQPNVISRRSLQYLAKYVDPNVLLDEEVEDMLLAYSDEFMDKVIEGACRLAVHRGATAVDTHDVEAYLERNCNIYLSADDKDDPLKVPKKTMATEAHKQRMALIKKTMKKS